MTHLPSWAVPGRKVVCVDDSVRPLMGDKLVKGSVYTISEPFLDVSGTPALRVREAKSDHPQGGYRLVRFRPVVTLEEDMLTFRSLLNTVPAIKELTE